MVRAARASLTSNFEKSLKKNETALDFCPSVRSKGLSGLSSPVPPIVEHHFPVQCAGGGAASAFAHNRRAGVAACGEAARGEVRAPVLIVVPVPGLLLTTMASQAALPSQATGPLLTLTVFTLVVTRSSEDTPGPLDSA